VTDEQVWGKPKPYIEEFFELIGGTIREFASNHNLKIEKYYQNIDGWELIFQHPKGGACYIDVIKKNEQQVLICGVWWIDDLRTSERYIKHTEHIECSIAKGCLKDELESIFGQIASWKKEELSSLGKSFEPLKKDDIEADLKRYPVPKI
jgi:hypothetical protein